MDRPRIKVVIKPKGTPLKPYPLLAAWDRDGRMSATLDRSVVKVEVTYEDGSVALIQRGADGREDHWINVYDNAQTGGFEPRERPAQWERQAHRDKSRAEQLKDIGEVDDYGISRDDDIDIPF